MDADCTELGARIGSSDCGSNDGAVAGPGAAGIEGNTALRPSRSRCLPLDFQRARPVTPRPPVLTPQFAAALRSAEGRRWLEQLLLVLLLVCVVHAGLGVRSVRLILKLAGIAAEFACSERTLQRLAERIREQMAIWEKQERKRLSASMIERSCVLLLDEHFHGGQHLCAVDAASGFVLLEKCSPSRSSASWTSALAGALSGLALRVLALCSDGARGIRGLTVADERVPAIADLFHVQYNIGKKISGPLARRYATAQRKLEQAMTQLHSEIRDDRGGPPTREAADGRQAKLDAVSLAQKHLSEVDATRQQFRALVREVGAVVHPIDPASGFWNTADQVKSSLRKLRKRLEKWGEDAGIGERMAAAVASFRRSSKDLVRGVSLWRALAEQAIGRLNATESVRDLVLERLVPYAYVLRHLRRSERASDRETSRATLAALRANLAMNGSPWRTMKGPMRRECWKFADEVASMLVRASSAIEGANGRSALWHHQRHRLDERENAARLVVQNYVIEDEHGRTAAHRFFGRPPKSLISWLRSTVIMPGEPRRGHRSSRREDHAGDLLAIV